MLRALKRRELKAGKAAAQREYNDRYRHLHPEVIKDARRRYYILHKEERKAYQRAYYKAHREQLKAARVSKYREDKLGDWLDGGKD